MAGVGTPTTAARVVVQFVGAGRQQRRSGDDGGRRRVGDNGGQVACPEVRRRVGVPVGSGAHSAHSAAANQISRQAGTGVGRPVGQVGSGGERGKAVLGKVSPQGEDGSLHQQVSVVVRSS